MKKFSNPDIQRLAELRQAFIDTHPKIAKSIAKERKRQEKELYNHWTITPSGSFKERKDPKRKKRKPVNI